MTLSGAGLTLYPMEQFVRPGRPVVYTARNNQKKPIAVEVTVESWDISVDGQERREPSNDIIVFPSQFILKGESTKRIKAGTRNKKPVKKEKAYRVTFRELPVSFEVSENEVSRVYMANAYRTSFYVQPKKRQPTITVPQSSWESGQLHLTFENSGNSHTHVTRPRLELKLKSGEFFSLDEEDDALDGLGGQNLHAEMTRNFVVDLSSKIAPDSVIGARLRVENGQTSEVKTFDLAWH